MQTHRRRSAKLFEASSRNPNWFPGGPPPGNPYFRTHVQGDTIVTTNVNGISPHARRGLLARERRYKMTPYILLMPAIVLLCAMLVYPLMRTIYISFFFWPYLSPERITFIGLGNYIRLFTQDESFLGALGYTLKFTGASIVLSFLLGLGMALVLERVTLLRNSVRSLIILPFMVAPIATGNIMRLMWARDFGLVNFVLGLVRLGPVNWLAEPLPAFWATVMSEVWRTTPFVALILLAGLNTVPSELYAAARVDGASALQVLGRIKLPLLMPSITVALVFQTIFKLRVFDLVFTLTGGGPGQATTPLGILLKNTYFRFFQAGYAGAIAVTLLLIGAVLSILYMKLAYREVEY